MSTTELVMEVLRELNASLRKLDRGPASYYFEKMEGYSKTLFERFCPFKVGSRVVMTKDYPCTGGWAGRDKMMVKGAKATVKEVDCRDGVFVMDIVFDNEFYESVNHKGVMTRWDSESTNKHTFAITEEYLVVVDV